MRERQRLFAWFTKCERAADYDTLAISVPTLPPGVVVHDPRNLDFIFRNESLFSKGDFVKSRAWDLFGHGIINADGDAWRLQRRAGAAFLSTANLRVLTDVALPRYLGGQLDRLGAVADSGSGDEVVDLQEVFHEVTTQLMGKMAYNMEMHTDDPFTTAFDFASGATAERFQNPLWFLAELVTGGRFRRSVAVVKSFGREIVARAVADRTHNDSSDKRSTPDPKAVSDTDSDASKLDQISGTLIHSFLDAIPDHSVVADAALNYLSAGRDTTAQALTWTFHLLFRSPAALCRIREEALSILGPASSQEISPAALARLTPQALPYALATFYEALRLYPPIPLEIKQLVSDRDVVLPDGTVLPPAAVVVWCPWALGRSRRTWGADADAFRPERWLISSSSSSGGEAVMVAQRPASEFPVFNGGPRSCLGKKMAEVIGVQVIAAMAVAFDFAPAGGAGQGPGRGERRSKISLTLPMEGGLPVTVRRRGAA